MLSVDHLYTQKSVKGTRNGAIYGILKNLCTMLNMAEFKGYFPVYCFDRGINPRRKSVYTDYKNKDVAYTDVEKMKLKDDYITQYRTQRNELIEVLSYMGIPSIIMENTEGDDIGNILCNMAEDVICITTDQDWLQNLSQDHVRVYNPIKKILYTEEKYIIENNISSIEEFIIRKSILGDTSDNIPSCCKGIGEKSVGEFVKYLNIYKQDNKYNFENYERDEKKCKELCEQNNVKYKKAYTNFIAEDYYRNEQLINLKYITSEEKYTIESNIKSTIMLSQSTNNYINALKKLNQLGVMNIDIDTIRREIMMRRKNIS